MRRKQWGIVWRLALLCGWLGLAQAQPVAEDETAQACEPASSIEAIWRPWQAVVAPLVREAPAKVVARESATVAPEVAGRIEKLPVRVGDRVAAGDVVAELDASLLRLAHDEAAAAYAAAQTRVAQAKRLLAQAERLLAERVGNRDNVAAAEEQLRIAEREAAARAAQRAQAEWRLTHAVVRAPFAGVVTARLAQEGNWVAAGQGIAVVTSAEHEVVAQVGDDQAAELAHAAASPRFVPFVTGHSSALTSDPSSDPAAEIALTWVATNAVRDAPGQRTTVRFRVTHPHPLTAGTVGRIRWQSSARIAPPEAVTTFDGRVGVWVRRNPTAPPHFLALPDALPGRSAVVALPSGWLPEETQIAVGRQGVLAWAEVGARAPRSKSGAACQR
ncbi:efflux RND transporter periplasmic adaptor subunit [Hydrogenophilus thiooxidans]|uniref:efflux RND transporter periplasmic adaptor subunit n=1 Tax=Hydrogenophilus thiooxidans TaxID=2820326 RepID=UPI001C220FB5